MLKLNTFYCFVKKEGGQITILPGAIRIASIKDAYNAKTKAKIAKKQGYELAEVKNDTNFIHKNVDLNRLFLGQISINL